MNKYGYGMCVFNFKIKMYKSTYINIKYVLNEFLLYLFSTNTNLKSGEN